MNEGMDKLWHEAGHAVAALVLGRQVDFIRVDAQGGCTRFELLRENPTDPEVCDQLIIDVAGDVAVILSYEKSTSLEPGQKAFIIPRLPRVSRRLKRALAERRHPSKVFEAKDDAFQAWEAAKLLPGENQDRLTEVLKAEDKVRDVLAQRWLLMEALVVALNRSDNKHLSESEILQVVYGNGGISPI